MKKEILQSILYNFIAIAISFIAVRITLDYLGEELYGKWGVALSLIYFLNIFEFGLGNSIRNHVTEFIINKKVKNKLKDQILSIWSFQIVLLYIISFTVLFVSILFSIKNFNLFNILCAVFFPLLVCSNLVRPLYNGIKKTRKVYKIKTLSVLYALAFLIIFTKTIRVDFFAIEIVLIVNIIPQIIIKLNNLRRFFKYELLIPFKFYFLIPKKKSIKLLIYSDIFKDGISYFSINIANLFLINSIPILLSNFIGDKEVTIFTLNQKLYIVFLQFFYVILTPFWSQLNHNFRTKSIDNLNRTVIGLFALSILLIIGIISIRFIENPFHKIWLGKTYFIDKFYTSLIAYYTLILGLNAILGHFLNAMNELKEQRKLAMLSSIMIVPVGILIFYFTNFQGASFIISINIFISIQMFILFIKSIQTYNYVRNSWIH